MKCYISVCPTHPTISQLVQADGDTPHITIVHPFDTEEPDEVTLMLRELTPLMGPFEVEFTGLRSHPNATETSGVLSLVVGESPELSKIRSHCVDRLGDKINPKYLFPFHLTLAKDLEMAEAEALAESLRSGFQPFRASLSSICVYAKDSSWKIISYNTLIGSEIE